MARPSLVLYVALILLAGTNPAQANTPVRELAELRTEYSKTYQLADGSRSLEISPTPIHRLDTDGEWRILSTDEVSICSVFSFGTGSVRSATKTTGDLSWEGAASAQQRKHGWMKFTLATLVSLPPANIESARIDYWLTSLINGNPTNIMVTNVLVDPIAANAGDLFNSVRNGTACLPQNHTSSQPYNQWKLVTLDNNGITAIRQSLMSGANPPWVAFGFRSEDGADRGGTAHGHDYYPTRPQLVITYTPPPYHDVGVTAITSPTGTVQPGTVVNPTGIWRNTGNQPMVFDAHCLLISPLGHRVYQQTITSQNLDPGGNKTIIFPPHLLEGEPGRWRVYCSTYAATDQNPLNDTLSAAFTLAPPAPYIDVEAYDVLSPSGIIEKNTNVIPSGVWKNNSNVVASFTAFFIIRKPGGAQDYRKAFDIQNVRPGAETTVVFPEHSIDGTTGTWTARCSTWIANDENPNNNAINETFQVVDELLRPDVEAVAVVAPVGYVDTNAVITPRARWRNRGDQPITFRAWFSVYDPDGEPAYTQSYEVLALAGRADTVLEFPQFSVGTKIGDYAVRCSTWADEDENHGNDVCTGKFRVIAGLPGWEFGWQEAKRRMPDVPSYKPVAAGGWLAYSSGNSKVYAAKGNKTAEFFAYHPFDDSWTTRADIPAGTEGKLPSKGCKATYDHNRNDIYMTKGANTLGFWRYSVEEDSWYAMPDVPLGTMKKKVKGGSDLEYVEKNGGCVYLLKGGKTEFYRFNVSADTWEILPDAPAGPKGKWDAGSFMVYDQNRYLYTHMAKHHMMWRYDIDKDSWTSDTLTPMPLPGLHGGKTKNKKMKDGGSAAWYDEHIYALKGGNTQQFFRYSAATDSWKQMDTIPIVGSTAKKKRVKTGADLVGMGNGAFFALKGNKCNELWRYVLRPTAFGPLGHPNTASPGTPQPAQFSLSVSPNPVGSGFATVRIVGATPWTRLGNHPNRAPTLQVFDALGRCVLARSFDNRHSEFGLPLDLRKVPAGVYLVRLETETGSASQKLVVQR